MGKNSYGSSALSNGRSHGGEKAGAPRVNAGGPGGGKSGMKAAKGMNRDSGVGSAAGGSAPGGMKTYKAGAGVKV